MNKIPTMEMLEGVLKGLNKIDGIQASAIASRDGLLICSQISAHYHAETLVALSATMMGAAEAASIELGKGIPDRIIVESKNGKLIGTGAGPKALLIVITGPEASLGMVLINIKKAVEKIMNSIG